MPTLRSKTVSDDWKFIKIDEKHFFKKQIYVFISFFFSIRVFFQRHWQFTGQQEKGGDHFYSTLPLPPAHEHWDIYLQLCIWDDYHVFLIVTLVFTRLLLNKIYHLVELPFECLIDVAMFVCLLDELILGFCYTNLSWETGGFELASTITLVLQANRLTKCASHPTYFVWKALFVLEIFTFLSRLLRYVLIRKRLDKKAPVTLTSRNEQHIITIHILSNSSRNKDNQAM